MATRGAALGTGCAAALFELQTVKKFLLDCGFDEALAKFNEATGLTYTNHNFFRMLLWGTAMSRVLPDELNLQLVSLAGCYYGIKFAMAVASTISLSESRRSPSESAKLTSCVAAAAASASDSSGSSSRMKVATSSSVRRASRPFLVNSCPIFGLWWCSSAQISLKSP